MDFDRESSLRGLVPLVMHRIIRDKPFYWEDLQEHEFCQLLDFIGDRWAVFQPDICLPHARWMLTFDDGNISDYDVAFRLLIEKKIKATFFVIVDKIGTPGHLNWAQVKEMHSYGMCIGSHGRSHCRMVALSKKEAQCEFNESRQQLEDFLGAPVLAFSYPFGVCSPQLHQLGFAAGYRFLCTSNHGVISSSSRIIPRNTINSAMGWGEIAKVMIPTLTTRFRWVLEDQVKTVIKATLGPERYMSWRNRVMR